jgi:hypothetical protein
MDFAFPDRVQNALFTVVLGNAYTYTRGMFGNHGVNMAGGERIPAPTTLRASLRVVF